MKELGIVYRRAPERKGADRDHLTPWGYCNANYAKESPDRKSTLSCLLNGPITWKLKKQISVALSTTEAEYYALGIACQEAVWLRQLCQEIFLPLNTLIHVLSDNTGAISLSDNPVFHNRSKHINIRWHFVRDLIHSKVVCSSHIPGVENGADILTKALNHFEHEQCVQLLGLE